MYTLKGAEFCPEHFGWEVEDKIATITLNRPDSLTAPGLRLKTVLLLPAKRLLVGEMSTGGLRIDDPAKQIFCNY